MAHDMLLTLLLADLSWRLLERPARRLLRAPRRRVGASALVSP